MRKIGDYLLGKVRLICEDDDFYADIIHAEIHEEGAYLPEIRYPNDKAREAEYASLAYDKLIVECYDLDEGVEILSAEIDELYTDKLTNLPQYKVTYGLDLEILNHFYDSQAGCLVVELK